MMLLAMGGLFRLLFSPRKRVMRAEFNTSHQSRTVLYRTKPRTGTILKPEPRSETISITTSCPP